MLGLGRYLQHKKLSTNPPDDEEEYDRHNNKIDFSFDDEDIGNDDGEHRSFGILPQSDDIFQVTYLGEEKISIGGSNAFQEKEGHIDMQQIYKLVNGPRFSPQNAMSRSKRMELTVNEFGINLTTSVSSSSMSSASSSRAVCGGKLTSSSNTEDNKDKVLCVPELLLLSTEPLHKKVLVAVSLNRGSQSSGLSGKKYNLSVLVCQKECHPTEIIDLCSQRLSTKPKNMSFDEERNCGKPVLVDKKRKYSPQHMLELVYTNNGSFVNPYDSEKDIKAKTVFSAEDSSKTFSSSLSDDLDLDDEFSKLAMKRTDPLPHHLHHDKSVDSILLIQEEIKIDLSGNSNSGGSSSATRRKSLSPSSSSNNISNGNNFFTMSSKNNKQQQQQSSTNKSNFFSPSFYNSYSRVSNGL